MPLFTKQPEEYVRNLNMYSFYIDDAAKILAVESGDSIEECREWVREHTGPNGERPLKDPRVIYLTKETPGNRELKIGTVSEYLKTVEERKCIMSPTMAVYFNPNEKRSLLAEYILINLAMRKKVKGEMFVAGMAGNKALKDFKNIVQSTYKIKNNSLSGAHASPSTPLYNKSSHSTLTSVCRCASGSANASNERFLTGNRHYYDANIAVANIISIVNHSDYGKIKHAMDLYDLVYPTAAEVLAAIKRSTDLYWNNAPQWFSYIESVVNGLSPIERAAYLYTADFWYLKELNPGFVYNMLGAIIDLPTIPITDNPAQYIKELDADEFALVGLLKGKLLHGRTIKDLIDSDHPDLGLVAAAAHHVKTKLAEFKPLYAAFWVTDNPPQSLAAFPTSIRRSAIVSDTDSTIFTVQDWTQWFKGKIDFSETSNNIAALVVYFASQVTKHTLATISGNMGVVPEKIHKISMKNEYVFPVFSLTTRAKHYYAYMSAREGNVYLTPELEVKGVALKNSKIPPAIMSKAHQLIIDIMDTVMREELVDLQAILKDIGDTERQILDSIAMGNCEYLTTASVKDPGSYANPDSSPYIYYGLWEDVFASRYGHSDPPPYFAIKASLTTTTKTALAEWLDSIEDPTIRTAMTKWIHENGKTTLTTVMLPESIVMQGGVPKEITTVIDSRKLVLGIMEPFYLILESLGYFINTDKAINLVSDRY